VKIIIIRMVVLLLSLSFTAFADVNYSSSAHGSSTDKGDSFDGVYRTSLVGKYAKGNCAHCHEQHGSVDSEEPEPNESVGPSGFLLLSDAIPDPPVIQNTYQETATACLGCHGGTQNNNSIVNNNYSTVFGGELMSEVDSILEALNGNSYHNLNDISVFVQGVSEFNVPSSATPCSACHNPHLAKNNSDMPNIGNPIYTAISRPIDHFGLYGDEIDERMPSSLTEADYYQPPNRIGGGLEPDGLSTVREVQALKTPNYNKLCIDCHHVDNKTIASTALGVLKSFDWSLEQHGGGDAFNHRPQDELLSPFSDAYLGKYTLSCMDCHEPHGSSNFYLIRTTINGNSVNLEKIETQTPEGTELRVNWEELCSSCHVAEGAAAIQSIHHQFQYILDCIDCHYYEANQGGLITNSVPRLRDCSTCHYHGASRYGPTYNYKTF